jgi:hypothetical protein
MTLVLLIGAAVAWLTSLGSVLALCRMARRGDAALARDVAAVEAAACTPDDELVAA